MEELSETAMQVLSPLQSLWKSFIDIFPGIVAAVFILIVGYLIAMLLGKLVHIVLSKLKVDKVLEKLKAPPSLSKLQISGILGQVTKWYIFIVFLGSAAEVLSLGALSGLLTRFVVWLPQLIIAVLVVFMGMIVAYYLSNLIEKHVEIKGAKTIAALFKGIVIFISIVIALEQIGIEVEILKNTFLIMTGGLALGLGIACGIGFGDALKKPAAKLIEGMRKRD